MNREEKRKTKREPMPFSGIGRIDVYVASPARMVHRCNRYFLWNLSDGGGSVMAPSSQFQVGESLRLSFEDNLSVYSGFVFVTVVWVTSDAFGFRFDAAESLFLDWAKSRFVAKD